MSGFFIETVQAVIKISIKREQDAFELFFDTDMLKKGVIKESDPSLTFTNEIFLKLGEWVAKEKKLIWSSVSCWLKKTNSIQLRCQNNKKFF